MIAMAGLALMLAAGNAGADAPCTEQSPARRADLVHAAYAAAEVEFLSRLDEVGLVGSTLARPERATAQKTDDRALRASGTTTDRRGGRTRVRALTLRAPRS